MRVNNGFDVGEDVIVFRQSNQLINEILKTNKTNKKQEINFCFDFTFQITCRFIIEFKFCVIFEFFLIWTKKFN